MGSPILFGIAEVGYFVAMMIYIGYFIFKNKTVGVCATTVAVVAFLSQTAALVLRWVESYGMGIGRAPLTNLYESLIFFVWCLMLGYLIIEFKYKNRTFGAFITPLAGLALGFIDLTGISKEIEPLVPALQSNWLLAHVTMSFIAYAAFGIAFATGMLYLVLSTERRTEGSYIFWTVAGSVFLLVLAAMGADYFKFKMMATSAEIMKSYLFKATFRSNSGPTALLSWIAGFAAIFSAWRYGYVLRRMLKSFDISLEFLEELNYKVVAVGFPIFTLGGLIFGAIWADQAWGVYWSWDPKETWSLITWLVYAFYLHARYLRGWRGNKIAVLSSIGFITVIFTYLGVNILLSGLHSYGEI
ncbi:c-type cytochrome biogenesis protein CcsB [Candidatus Magnetominusculus dajiuhuensis]|uniref:c-type cytochrome biogenesis protein CcsB n=1 Tax=Candidatus Magnetominusculus dajiuhuensis TaxID=3137712 RepID=UPI003B437034